MPLPLLALFLCAFAFGTTEFVIAGILPQVAEGLLVSVPSAGYLVSGYALGIAIGGPLLTLATAHLPRRTLLIGLLVAFIVGQIACAMAPDFATMLAIRVAVAIAHGAYFGVAMVVGVNLVRPEQRGMAVAIILAGLTVSNVIGVPAGAVIGTLWGWRTTFWSMFGLGVLSLAALIVLLPRAAAAGGEQPSLMQGVKALGRQQAWTSLILMLMLMIGQFVPYTYIAPLLKTVTGLQDFYIAWVLLLIGVGSTVGVLIGGKLAGGHLMRWMIALAALQSITLAAIYVAAPYPIAMTAALFIWGGINFAFGTLIQTRILTWTADAPTLASSLIPSGFNIGIALAAFIGASLLNAGFSYRALPVVGIAALAFAAIVATLSYLAEQRSGVAPPAASGAVPEAA